MVTHKYIDPISLEYWIWRVDKPRENIYIIWRVVLNYFDTITSGLVWIISRRNRVRLGLDTWPSCGQNHLLPPPLIEHLRYRGYTKLSHISNPATSSTLSQGWLSTKGLGLEEAYHGPWQVYLQAFSNGYIRFADRDDKIIWSISPYGYYSLKPGYIFLMVDKPPPLFMLKGDWYRVSPSLLYYSYWWQKEWVTFYTRKNSEGNSMDISYLIL